VTRRPRGDAPASAARRPEPPSRARSLLASALVFLAGCAVFAPTLGYSFLNWDDDVYILRNPWIGALSVANLQGIFTRPYFQNYLPLHLFSYMLDHALWGLRAMGYHLSSVLLHGLNAVLCLAVVRRMSRSLAIGFLAALFFALHPSHVEAVAWVSSRKEVLSTTFLLLSLLFYLRARRGETLRPWPYAASVLFFLGAMLSKVSVLVLPAFLLLLDAVPPGAGTRARPSWARALAEKIPYGIVGAILIFVNSRVQVTARAAYAHDPLRYLTVKGHAVWNYLGLLFGLGGNPDYDLPRIAGLGTLLALAGWLVLPAAGYALYRSRRRLEFLGVGWVLLTLLPALLFPLVTYMADRYLYAPSIGFCWALAAALAGARARWARGAAVALSVALLGFFTARTLEQSRHWRSSETLWTYALTQSRDYRAFNNLAQVRMEQKRWSEAEELLRRGTAAANVTSWQSLGVLHYTQGRYPEALAETDRALAILAPKAPDPTLLAELRYNRGAVLWAMGKPAEAAEEWRAALRANPGHARAREWLDQATRAAR
jgi:tetratricopeptide (TPR) repeat protein